MRIRLSLIGGVPSDFVFGVEGGTFGRSMKCQWVLPDEERILSAVHGRVVFENNKFTLIDESTNGIFLDGRQQPIGRGNSVALTSGLQFRAARHLIEAQILPAQSAAFSMPAAPSAPMTQGYMTPGHQPGWQSGAPSAEQALRERSDMGDMWAKNSQDPLVYLGGAPLAEPTRLGRDAAPAANAFPSGNPRAATNVDALFAPPPQEHDPFAGLGFNGHGQPAGSPQIPANFIPVNTPLAMPTGQNFQTAPIQHQPVQPQPLMPQPSPLFPQAEQLPPMPMAIVAPPVPPIPQPAAPAPIASSHKLIPDDFDPLSILAAPIRRAPGPRPDIASVPVFLAPLPVSSPAPQAVMPIAAMPVPATPVLPASATQPIPQFPIPPSAPLQVPVPPLPTPSSAPPAAREPLSPSLMADIARLGEPAASRAPAPEANSGDFDAIAAMKARREERKAKLMAKAGGDIGQPSMPVIASAQPQSASPSPAPPVPLPPIPHAVPPSPVQISAPPPLSPVPFAAAADNAALVTLFAGMGLQGADISSKRQDQVMREVGEMVRAFSEGLILLLSARRMVKSEFRMDETQIQPEENNPFKHFKMAELALDEMFVTRSGGFQAPAEAAGSALEDLKQHVMLTMSAMQRAIKLLMERLSPENVAQDHEAEGAHRIRGLVSRKGKWETYVETHQRMSGNIDGVARQLIAEAFAQVQEEQARRIASQYWENKK